MLYTARSVEFRSLEGQKKAAATCKLLGLDGNVSIGGDGSYRGLVELAKQGVSVVGVPATIDNDIVCTDYTIGYDTAANTAVEAIDRLRDTMQSHERCSVVEVMGRNAGHLALYVGLATGATAVLVPEKPLDFDGDVIDRIRQARLAGNTHFMIIVAEGAGSAIEIGKGIGLNGGLCCVVADVGIDFRSTQVFMAQDLFKQQQIHMAILVHQCGRRMAQLMHGQASIAQPCLVQISVHHVLYRLGADPLVAAA